MKFKATFHKTEQSFRSDFGEVHNISDGGYERGYAAGEEAGYANGYNKCTEDMQDDLQAKYDEGYENGNQAGLTEGIVQGIEQGKQAERNKFWNEQTANGTRTNFDYAFYGDGWNDETFTLPYTIQPTRAGYMFKDCLIAKSEYLKNVDFSKNQNFVQTFYESTIEELPIIDCSLAGAGWGGLNQTFMYCRNLKKIEKVILPKNPMGIDGFGYCDSLAEIRFEGTASASFNMQWSISLSKESIISIINALSDSTSGFSVTFSRQAVDYAFGHRIDDYDWFDGSDTAEWKNLIATKPDWTIKLA